LWVANIRWPACRQPGAGLNLQVSDDAEFPPDEESNAWRMPGYIARCASACRVKSILLNQSVRPQLHQCMALPEQDLLLVRAACGVAVGDALNAKVARGRSSEESS
jgi:hypothetical protein